MCALWRSICCLVCSFRPLLKGSVSTRRCTISPFWITACLWLWLAVSFPTISDNTGTVSVRMLASGRVHGSISGGEAWTSPWRNEASGDPKICPGCSAKSSGSGSSRSAPLSLTQGSISPSCGTVPDTVLTRSTPYRGMWSLAFWMTWTVPWPSTTAIRLAPLPLHSLPSTYPHTALSKRTHSCPLLCSDSS